jgi:hypothetical protein
MIQRDAEGKSFINIESRGHILYQVRCRDGEFRSNRQDDEWHPITEEDARQEIQGQFTDGFFDEDTLESDVNRVVKELKSPIQLLLTEEEAINLRAILADAAASGWEPRHVVESLRTKLLEEG